MSILVPYVIEKSGREERAMDIYSRLLKDRIIFLGTQVNDVVANAIVAQLLFLQFEDEKADNPVESATQEMLKDKIEQVLKTLTYREREIIKLRYGIGDGYTYTLEEVGRIFKVTRERVRQVEAKAIRKLQHPVRARKLEGFLPGGISIHNAFSAHGPDRATYEKASKAELKPQKIDNTLAFMWESRHVFRPTKFALQAKELQKDYDKVWDGF